jgi:hypothetical protein
MWLNRGKSCRMASIRMKLCRQVSFATHQGTLDGIPFFVDNKAEAPVLIKES